MSRENEYLCRISGWESIARYPFYVATLKEKRYLLCTCTKTLDRTF